MRLKAFLILFISLGMSEANGQTIIRLGGAASYGSIIAHDSELLPISNSNPMGITGNIQFMDVGRKSWETCDCFFYLGADFSYENFNNPEILGNALSLTGTFEPILWRSAPWTLSLKSGIGISYLDKVYDPVTNPDNIFFSNPLSFKIFLAPTLGYRFSPEWSGQLFFTYNHISNGGQSQPNKGMNYPMAGIGVYHYLRHEKMPDHSASTVPQDWEFYLEASYTSKQASWSDKRKPAFSLAGGTSRSISAINALGGGLEISQDRSLEVKDSRWERIIPGPFIAHHFLFGRIDFSQRFAVYAFKPAAYNDYSFYQRYVLKYRVWNDWELGAGLKAHGHVAENIEVRLGRRF